MDNQRNTKVFSPSLYHHIEKGKEKFANFFKLCYHAGEKGFVGMIH